jgi:hypothetical protein
MCHHPGVRGLVFIAATLAAALLIAATGSFAKQRPALALHFKASVVVDGSHFKAHERVKVMASSGGSATIRASSSGAFSVTLHGAPVDRCSGLVVRARGSAGSVAMIRRPPLPACAPMRGVGSAG